MYIKDYKEEEIRGFVADQEGDIVQGY